MNLYRLQTENPWNIPRLIYQLGETGPSNARNESQEKKPPPEETHEQLKRLQDDISAFERYRLEALENFKKKVLENRHDFKGSDFTDNETLTNPVFQYAYDKLDEFFKKDFNPNWPIKIYKNWMNHACDTIASDILNYAPINNPFALLLQTDKSRIDAMLGYTYDFETFFAMNEPQLFEEWGKQNGLSPSERDPQQKLWKTLENQYGVKPKTKKPPQ